MVGVAALKSREELTESRLQDTIVLKSLKTAYLLFRCRKQLMLGNSEEFRAFPKL